MSCSLCSKKPKKIPYGSKRTKTWCYGCDVSLIPPEPNKKRERRKAKKEIKEVE